MKQSFLHATALPPWAISVFSGFFLAASAILPGAPACFFIGVIILFYSVNQARTYKETFKLGSIAGVIYMGAAHFWFLQLHPLSWAGITNTSLSLFLVFSIWVLVLILTGIGVGCFALLAHKKEESSFPFYYGLFFAGAWVLVEKMRAISLSILFYSPNISLAPHHSYTDAGYTVSQLNLFSHLLPVGGVSSVSFVAVLVAWLLYYLLERQKNIALAFAIGFFVIGSYLMPIPNESFKGLPADVGVVTTSFEPEFTQEALTDRVTSLDQLLSKLTTEVDILVLPENSFYLREKGLFSTSSFTKFNLNTLLLVDSSPEANSHRIHYYRPDSGEISIYEKVALMPQGEYMAWWEMLGAQIFHPSWLVENYWRIHVKKGSGTVVVRAKQGLVLGGLLCSEIGSPYLHRNLVEKGATVLVNPASHSVFHNSSIFKFQMQAIARSRAMELGRYLVIAGNATDSIIISPRGIFVAELPATKKSLSLAVVKIESIEKQTIYVQTGDIVPYASLFLVIYYCSRRLIDFNMWRKK